MESYNEFLDRINSFQNPVLNLGDGDFEVNPSLKNKVDTNNKLKPFFGDTVVFDLDDSAKEDLLDYREKLYECAPDCFCERLCEDTFHMTLHDLSNAMQLSDTAIDSFNNEIALLKKLKEEPLMKQTIKMESTCAFNMVNTSLVLGLKPINNAEYIKLIKLYSYVDDIKALPYPFTPHITLAYYSYNGFSVDSKRQLETVVNSINKNKLIIELDIDKLFYQKFINMNEYINVFNFIKQ